MSPTSCVLPHHHPIHSSANTYPSVLVHSHRSLIQCIAHHLITPAARQTLKSKHHPGRSQPRLASHPARAFPSVRSSPSTIASASIIQSRPQSSASIILFSLNAQHITHSLTHYLAQPSSSPLSSRPHSHLDQTLHTVLAFALLSHSHVLALFCVQSSSTPL